MDLWLDINQENGTFTKGLDFHFHSFAPEIPRSCFSQGSVHYCVIQQGGHPIAEVYPDIQTSIGHFFLSYSGQLTAPPSRSPVLTLRPSDSPSMAPNPPTSSNPTTIPPLPHPTWAPTKRPVHPTNFPSNIPTMEPINTLKPTFHTNVPTSFPSPTNFPSYSAFPSSVTQLPSSYPSSHPITKFPSTKTLGPTSFPTSTPFPTATLFPTNSAFPALANPSHAKKQSHYGRLVIRRIDEANRLRRSLRLKTVP